MIIASLLITNLSYLAAICVVPLILAAASRIPLKHFFSRTALIPVFAAVISIPLLFLTAGTPVVGSKPRRHQPRHNPRRIIKIRHIHRARMVLCCIPNIADSLNRL